MAKYMNRDVNATKLSLTPGNEFKIYSSEYPGLDVKKSDLVFTAKEKADFLKLDEEAYKTNPDTYKVEEVVVPTKDAKKAPEKEKTAVDKATEADKPSSWPFAKKEA